MTPIHCRNWAFFLNSGRIKILNGQNDWKKAGNYQGINKKVKKRKDYPEEGSNLRPLHPRPQRPIFHFLKIFKETSYDIDIFSDWKRSTKTACLSNSVISPLNPPLRIKLFTVSTWFQPTKLNLKNFFKKKTLISSYFRQINSAHWTVMLSIFNSYSMDSYKPITIMAGWFKTNL